jgi:tetratricopeptide (TPR) repeat protein
MNEAVFEQYKEALRRGHVAAQRGRLDLAIDAYAEAATLAPDRPVPHVGLGAILVRLGRVNDALLAYDRALERAPRDEAALGGRADVLIAVGRRIEAAETLDRLSELQEASRRLADACDSAGRALEQAESRNRRRHVKDLATRLRETDGQAAEAAIARAMAVLEPPKTSAEQPVERGVNLAAEAMRALDAGEAETARAGLVAAAHAHARDGETDAALECCYLVLSFAPDDSEAHLALVDLYLTRGWRGHAAEKLALLARMAELTGDSQVRDLVVERAMTNFKDDPRLAVLTA